MPVGFIACRVSGKVCWQIESDPVSLLVISEFSLVNLLIRQTVSPELKRNIK